MYLIKLTCNALLIFPKDGLIRGETWAYVNKYDFIRLTDK